MSDVSDEESVDFQQEETERVILDPTNVRERIDATLESLANLKTDTSRILSRAELMETLTR